MTALTWVLSYCHVTESWVMSTFNDHSHQVTCVVTQARMQPCFSRAIILFYFVAGRPQSTHYIHQGARVRVHVLGIDKGAPHKVYTASD